MPQMHATSRDAAAAGMPYILMQRRPGYGCVLPRIASVARLQPAGLPQRLPGCLRQAA